MRGKRGRNPTRKREEELRQIGSLLLLLLMYRQNELESSFLPSFLSVHLNAYLDLGHRRRDAFDKPRSGEHHAKGRRREDLITAGGKTNPLLPSSPSVPSIGPPRPTYGALRAAKHRWLHTVEGSPSKENGWTLDSPKDVSEIQISWT